jgi:hypothetical protein
MNELFVFVYEFVICILNFCLWLQAPATWAEGGHHARGRGGRALPGAPQLSSQRRNSGSGGLGTGGRYANYR